MVTLRPRKPPATKAVGNEAVKKASTAKTNADKKDERVKVEASKEEDIVSSDDQQSEDDWATAVAVNSDDADSDSDNDGSDEHEQDGGEMDGQDGDDRASNASEEEDDEVTEVQTKTPSSRKRGSGRVTLSRKTQRGRKGSRNSEASDDAVQAGRRDS